MVLVAGVVDKDVQVSRHRRERVEEVKMAQGVEWVWAWEEAGSQQHGQTVQDNGELRKRPEIRATSTWRGRCKR